MRIILAAFATSIALSGSALAVSETASGTWLTSDQDSKIRIAPCGATYCASIVWVRPRAPGEENAHPALGDRDLVGTQLSTDLRRTGSGELSGSILNPENGKTYQVTLRLKDPNALELEGCILGGLLCGSQTWTRAPEDVAAAAGPKSTASTKPAPKPNGSATRATIGAAAGLAHHD